MACHSCPHAEQRHHTISDRFGFTSAAMSGRFFSGCQSAASAGSMSASDSPGAGVVRRSRTSRTEHSGHRDFRCVRFPMTACHSWAHDEQHHHTFRPEATLTLAGLRSPFRA